MFQHIAPGKTPGPGPLPKKNGDPKAAKLEGEGFSLIVPLARLQGLEGEDFQANCVLSKRLLKYGKHCISRPNHGGFGCGDFCGRNVDDVHHDFHQQEIGWKFLKP
ncbi:hypothetical protein [Geitlerinema sp. PCC 7407]|uniref:hypothetical protein n=1 Tax=Geitlerinema sp. PCC 7407 TaxID=1173025 RepID=UPI00167FC36F|nr:hypothetical protein [Geitlerinema sp. PCC 7407]